MKAKDLEKIIAKHKRYDKYVGGQIIIYNDYEDYEYCGNIREISVKKEDKSERLIVSLDLLAMKVIDPTVRWIAQGQREYTVTLSTEHFDLCSPDEKSDGRIVIDPPFTKEVAIIYPKDHPSITPIIIEEDVGRRKDGSKQIDTDIMKLYLLKDLCCEDDKLETLLEKITPTEVFGKTKITLRDISDKYIAIFSEHLEENHSRIYLYLSIEDRGIMTISSHQIYIPKPEPHYYNSDLKFFHPEGAFKAILTGDTIKLDAKMERSYKYHNGYNWEEYKFGFNIEKEIDLKKLIYNH